MPVYGNDKLCVYTKTKDMIIFILVVYFLYMLCVMEDWMCVADRVISSLTFSLEYR
jgi:hypothetical protein